MNTKLNNKKAFTIIEVVLVLAIAGLIFLIVFLALPGLQRSRRDTQRKSTFGNFTAALENSASNSGGKYPTNVTSTNYTTGCITYGLYLCPVATFSSGFTPASDPQGNPYYVVTSSGANYGPNVINYVQGGYCDGIYATTHGVAASNGGTDNGLGTAYGYAASTSFESGGQCKSVPAAK